MSDPVRPTPTVRRGSQGDAVRGGQELPAGALDRGRRWPVTWRAYVSGMLSL